MEEIDLNTVRGMEAGTAAGSDSLPELRDEGSGVLALHAASLYDMYTNAKHSASGYIKRRVMQFMRHEIDSNVPTRSGASNGPGPRDVEGGNATRASNITYDSLIFKITLLLGFMLQFPVMWVAGGILFLVSNNFKASTIKWGCVNIFLAALSIVYVVNEWQVRTAMLLYEPTPDDTLVFESGTVVEPWVSTINDRERSLSIKSFTFSDPLLWRSFDANDVLVSGAPFKLSKDGKLVDPAAVSGDHVYHCAQGADVGVSGWVQIGAMFSNTATTQRSVSASIHTPPGKLPVVYNPHDTMVFDVGLKCVSNDLPTIFIGVNATRKNDQGIQSDAFYVSGNYTCSLAYTTTGCKPVVHSVYIRTL